MAARVIVFLGAGIFGVIAFAVFVDLKQFAEDIEWAGVAPRTYFFSGFGLFTAAWLSNFVSFAAALAIPAAKKD